MRQEVWLALAACACFAEETRAQPGGVVRGFVKATGGDLPIAGAVVQLGDRPDSVRTSTSGEFVLERIPSGSYALRVRALGYSPKSRDIVVTDTMGWRGTIELERVAQELPEVKVVDKPPQFAGTTRYDDFFRRRKGGRGYFRTYDELMDAGTIDLLSALERIPGVSVSTTVNQFGDQQYRFRIARCSGEPPNIAVYMNGNIMPGVSRSGGLSEFLRSIPIRNVLFFEFYRGASEIPSDIERGDNCAAILIWTP
jgi:hypothetical protein